MAGLFPGHFLLQHNSNVVHFFSLHLNVKSSRYENIKAFIPDFFIYTLVCCIPMHQEFRPFTSYCWHVEFCKYGL